MALPGPFTRQIIKLLLLLPIRTALGTGLLLDETAKGKIAVSLVRMLLVSFSDQTFIFPFLPLLLLYLRYYLHIVLNWLEKGKY